MTKRYYLKGNGMEIAWKYSRGRSSLPYLCYRRDGERGWHVVGQFLTREKAMEFMDALSEMCRAEWWDAE
jgi:hypothetical protein